MEALPFEAQSKIFSFLSLNDQANCRLVCQALKSSVEYHLRITTHLRILHPAWYAIDEKVESYIHQTYLSKNFVSARAKVKFTEDQEYQGYPNDLFFSFLGKYCPNLQVLDGKDYSFTYGNLLQLPPNLLFFRCCEIKPFPGDKVLSAKVAFSLLKNLETFDAIYDIDLYEQFVEIAKQLSSKNKCVVKLLNPSREIINAQALKSIMSVGLKCLEYVVSFHSNRLHPIYPNMARHLIDMSMYFLPTDDFCRGHLPSLRYLNIDQDDPLTSASYKNVLFTSPRLKSFTYRGKLSSKMLVNLFAHFHSLEELTIFNVDVEVNEEESQDKFTFALLPNVQKFTFKMDRPFELSNFVSDSLVHFEVDNLSNMDFNLPNLKVFHVKNAKMEKLPPALLTSLPKSPKLQILALEFKLKTYPTPEFLQCLLDTFSRILQLKDLSLLVKAVDEDNDPPSSGIVVKQLDFASCTFFRLKLPCGIIFYPLNSFEKLTLGDDLKLDHEGAYYSVTGRESGSSRVMVDQDMDKLKELHINSPPPEWIVPQLKYLREIESIYYTVHESKHNVSSALCESILIFSNKLKYFRWKYGIIELDLLHKLFDYFHSLETLKEVDFNIELRESVQHELLRLPMPSHIERLTIRTKSPLELTGQAPDSLHYLTIETSNKCSFNCPKLKELHVVAKAVSVKGHYETNVSQSDETAEHILDSLTNCHELKSLHLSLPFYPSAKISTDFFQKLINVASIQFTGLETMKVSGGFWSESNGKLILRQCSFPNLKRLAWDVPIDTVFYPEDVFDSFFFMLCDQGDRRYESLYAIFSRKEPEVEFTFSINCLTLIVKDVYFLYNLTRVHLNYSGKLSNHQSVVNFMNELPNIKIIEVDEYDGGFEIREIWKLFELGFFLKQFTGINFSQYEATRFLTNLQTSSLYGPIHLCFISKSCCLEVMTDDLHQQLNKLDRWDFITHFSNWTCQCEDDKCWLKKHDPYFPTFYPYSPLDKFG